mmetsp:Transcript_15418/g.33303  ORF Transcript_15418/g.33303 Transcript_15418/m.33303 type:complete len:221 (-) Transcript_15418:2105-2767(-)
MHYLCLHLLQEFRRDWKLRTIVLVLVVDEPIRKILRIIPCKSIVGCIHHCLFFALAKNHGTKSQRLGIIITVVILVLRIILASISDRQNSWYNLKTRIFFPLPTTHSCLNQSPCVQQLLLFLLTHVPSFVFIQAHIIIFVCDRGHHKTTIHASFTFPPSIPPLHSFNRLESLFVALLLVRLGHGSDDILGINGGIFVVVVHLLSPTYLLQFLFWPLILVV